MKKLALTLILCAGTLSAAQSVQVVSGNPSTAITAVTAADPVSLQWTERVHDITGFAAVSIGPMEIVFSPGGNIDISPGGSAPAADNSIVARALLSSLGSRTDVLVRLQRFSSGSVHTYTLELCNTVGGGCITPSVWDFTPGTGAWNTTYQMGFRFTQYKLAFLRWSSTLDPIGSLIVVDTPSGNLGDWEAEGNLNDQSGHAQNMSGGSVAYSTTPPLPPGCLTIAEQAFGIGKPTTLTASCFSLDGSGTVSYRWTETTSQGVSFFSATSATTLISGFSQFGPVEFDLTVTDGSSQTMHYTVLDGAVEVDSRDIVITKDPLVDYIIGPQIRLGANPMKAYDAMFKTAIDIQGGALSTNYTYFFDAASTGTVSVNPTSVCGNGGATAYSSGATYAALDVVSYLGLYYMSFGDGNVGNNPTDSNSKFWKPMAGRCLTGSGTHFLTSLLSVVATITGNVNASTTSIPVSSGLPFGVGSIIHVGTENMPVVGGGTGFSGPTTLTVLRGKWGTTATSHTNGDSASVAPTNFFVVWGNNGANRVFESVDAVIDDTTAIMTYQWLYPAYGATSTTETNVQYSGNLDPVVIGNYGVGSTSTPGLYYDCVKAFRAMYARTGMRKYWTWYMYAAYAWWHQPYMNQGTNYNITNINLGTNFKLDPRAHNLTGMLLYAHDLTGAAQTTAFAGLRLMWDYESYQLSVGAQNQFGFYDQRVIGFTQQWVSECAQFDPDPTHKAACLVTIQNAMLDKTHGQSVWDYNLSPNGSFPANHNYYASWLPLAAFPSDTGASVDLVNGQTTFVGHKTHFLSMEYTNCSGQHFIGTVNQGDSFPNTTRVAFLPALTAIPLDNSTRETVDVYQLASVQGDTGATLCSAYQGTTRNGAGFDFGSYRFELGGGTVGYGGQPFMGGIDLRSMMNVYDLLKGIDAATAARVLGYARGIAYWLKTNGYANPATGNTGGMHYLVDYMGCAAPGALQTTECIAGNLTASATRTDAGEAVEGLSRYYMTTHDPVIRDFVDKLYAEMWCKDPSGPLCPTLGDGSYINDFDGGFYVGTQAINGKWIGFFGGYDVGAAWPAIRMHGFVNIKHY